MKKCKKMLAFLLTVVTITGIFSCATTVFAEDYNKYVDSKAYQEKLLTETVETETEKAEIVCEVEEKRDEYSKTYKRADGSYTSVLSQTPLHTYENGKWKDIDNELKTDGEKIENTDGKFNIAFPKTISEENKITIENQGENISFSINDIDSSSGVVAAPEADEADIIETDLSKTVSEITYENIDENTDIQYIVSSNSVKENIIVNNRESLKNLYSFDIEKGDLSATLDNENNLIFKNDKNETVFTIPAPVMTDAENAVSYDIAVNVKNADKSILTLTYTPSKEWLESADRVYPVVIDPVIELPSLRRAFIDDTVISYSTENPGNENEPGVNQPLGFVADYVSTTNNETTVIKSDVLVKLNMDAFAGFKQPNITVTDFNFVANGAVANGNILVKAINGSWDSEEITYNDVYPSDETAPAITYEDEIVDYYTGINPKATENEQNLICLNITELFNEWLSGEKANNGFAIVAEEYVSGLLYLDGYIEAINSGKKTYYYSFCTIDYADTSSANDSYEYLTQEAGRAGTVNVNTFNRNLSLTRADLSMDGLRMPVSIDFNYNTALGSFLEILNTVLTTTNGEGVGLPFVYGNNWLPSYFQGIFQTSDTQIQVFTGEGTLVTFNQTEETVDDVTTVIFEEDETSDSGYTLEVIDQEIDISPANVKLTSPDGNISLFNENGLLAKIQEGEANSDGAYDKTTVSYDPENPYKIDCVTDGIGRKYDFTIPKQAYFPKSNALHQTAPPSKQAPQIPI